LPNPIDGQSPTNGRAKDGKTRERTAAPTGYSHTTLDKAEAVLDAAEREPEVYGPIADRMKKTGKVDPAYKAMKKEAEPPPPPPAHFISDTVLGWLDQVHRKLSGIRSQYGSWGEASKDEHWDKKRTGEVRQKLTALHHAIGEVLGELP
jgi:hypothetical protein